MSDIRMPNPTDEQIDIGAKALADADNHLWSAMSDGLREKFRQYARVVLVAAAGVSSPANDASQS